MKFKLLKKISIAIILSSVIFNILSCAPYNKDQVLCEYEDLNCLYYTKNEFKKYKYSDYIVDDISNGEYKNATPSLADYKSGTGLLDYDIPKYVEAKMSFEIKKKLIENYKSKIDEMCKQVKDDYYTHKNYYVYYYDKNTNTSKLLYDGLVSNIAYDDESPMISFDYEDENNLENKEVSDGIKGRKIKLSDIVESNTSLEGYMNVILATGKSRMKFFMDKRIDNDPLFKISTASNIIE